MVCHQEFDGKERLKCTQVLRLLAHLLDIASKEEPDMGGYWMSRP